MNTIPVSAIRTSASRYFACIRLQDILVLQGPPILGAAFAVGRAGTVDVGPLLAVLAGNLFLMTHVFLLNDWAGLSADLADPNKSSRVFTARGAGKNEVAGVAAMLLVVSLLIFGTVGAVAIVLALAIAALSAVYSLPAINWKGRPILNSAVHLCGGVLHFLLGYCVAQPLDGRGVALGSYFALIFAAGHLAQEVRDFSGDMRNAIRTNAVAFGSKRTFVASVALFAAAHALFLVLTLRSSIPRPLALLVILFGLQLYWSVSAASEGLTYASVSRLQARYRAMYAAIGVVIVAALLLTTGLPAVVF